ncbi:hypothetical protein Tco_1078894 [Tanacetum coccineum]|uniref:Integrase, catalytic region, zinc finger, CCHC-type, peptidase aspartic, catalytic n=1 Tax=Tanacetum coccineum TaxID=301880 RepID=A0ABQ5HR70_9ASTR
MTTLAEHIIVVGAKNRPPMLEKSMYDSWASRIRLFIKGKKNAQQLQDDYDVQATNIILYGLPPDVYELVNHQEAAKDIWDRVKLLMKDTELSYQERKCRLYNLVDKFAYVQGETLYEYYWRFSQLINDTHTIGMTMQQVQVNTKFLNALPPEWSKFVTDVKLAKSLYTTNYDQLYAYLSQHERHANEVPLIHHQHHYTPVNPQQQSVSPQPFISPPVTQQSQAEFPQLDSSLAVPTFQQGEDPIDCINKAMAFLSAVASRFPPSNSQLRTSSNPRNQATIQDGRVIVQQVQGRQTQSFVGTRNRGIATTSRGNYVAGQAKVVKCYNCLGERAYGKTVHSTKEAKKFCMQLAFIADPGIAEVQVAQQTIPQNSAFQTEDLDAYDSDCDDISSATTVSMANLSSYDSDVLYEESQNVALKNELRKLKGKNVVDAIASKPTDKLDAVTPLNKDKDFSVAKLLSENKNLRKEQEDLKSIYKDQFESIRKTRVQSKEQSASLISQINEKSVENSDLNAQLQEKVFAIAALKNELRKLKGKNVVDTAVSVPSAIIAPGMFKLDI